MGDGDVAVTTTSSHVKLTYEGREKLDTCLSVTWLVLTLVSLVFSFEVLPLYDQQLGNLNEAASLSGLLREASGTLIIEFKNRTAAGESLCEIEYFESSGFDVKDLLNMVESTRLALVLSYVSGVILLMLQVGRLLWDCIRGLVSQEKRTATHANAPKNMPTTPELQVSTPRRFKPLENEDELKDRVRLRGETNLFLGFHGLQVSLQVSVVALYALLETSNRGIYCYSEYKLGRLSSKRSLGDIDDKALIFFGFSVASMLWAGVVMALRWDAYIVHKRSKVVKETRLTLRIGIITLCFMFILGALSFATLVALTYGDVYEISFGYEDIISTEVLDTSAVLFGVTSLVIWLVACCWCTISSETGCGVCVSEFLNGICPCRGVLVQCHEINEFWS